MAAIYQWYPSGTFIFTTPPYPIEDIDNLNWTVEFDVGYEYGVVIESVETTAAIIQGTILLVYLASGTPVESVETSASINQGTILQIYLATGIPVESVGTSASIQQGTLVLGVVRHTEQPAESIDLTVEWTGGTVT